MKRAVFAIAILTALVPFLPAARGAQTRFMYSSGQSVHRRRTKAGWPNADGSFTMFFGYMNSNWQQEFDIPIGPQNSDRARRPRSGAADAFLSAPQPVPVHDPRAGGFRHEGADLDADDERQDRERAYASLKSDYQIDPQVISTEVGGDFGSLRDELRTNKPPDLSVVETKRSVKVGEPLTLTAVAKDPDNIPARRGSAKPLPEGQPATISAAALYRPPSSIVAQSGPGLRFSWIVYRGNAGAVTFTPDQMKTWTDTRAYANSPWSPPWTIPLPPADNKWLVQATFTEPGTYVLRGVASDGSLFTYENVTVIVTK